MTQKQNSENNNHKKILIDIGSSTVKVYIAKENQKLYYTHSIPFRKGFDPKQGLSEINKNELIEVIEKIKNKYPKFAVKTYATALFRELNNEAKVKLIDEVYLKTGIFLNIISHELENFYLEVALTGKYQRKKGLLLVNIGGGSTELVVMKNRFPIEKHNIKLGISTILAKYPGVNRNISTVHLDGVVEFIKGKLPNLSNGVDEAFYNGGELKYMQLTGYNLTQNKLFKDSNHPSIISLQDFKKKNEEIFHEVTLAYLESLMPSDPKWMHGARACSALAQAVFEKYNINIIVPSNSNLLDGVMRQEFRQVTISGSFRKHLTHISKLRRHLVSQNIKVLSPRFIEPKNPNHEFVIFEGEENMTPLELERHHLRAILDSDALIVCNPEGYVGASAMLEIGFSHSHGKRIIFTEVPEEFMLNTLPAEIGL